MVRINLLPSDKRSQKRLLPKIKFQFKFDILVASAICVGILVMLVMAGVYWNQNSKLANLESEVDTAIADSIRVDHAITIIKEIKARQERFNERIKIIAEIDKDRFIWVHLMDEVSTVLNEYTWLERLVEESPLPNLSFSITGVTLNNLTLARFMSDLESIQFIQKVRLVSSTESIINGTSTMSFVLRGEYNFSPIIHGDEPGT